MDRQAKPRWGETGIFDTDAVILGTDANSLIMYAKVCSPVEASRSVSIVWAISKSALQVRDPLLRRTGLRRARAIRQLSSRWYGYSSGRPIPDFENAGVIHYARECAGEAGVWGARKGEVRPDMVARHAPGRSLARLQVVQFIVGRRVLLLGLATCAAEHSANDFVPNLCQLTRMFPVCFALLSMRARVARYTTMLR